MFSMFKKSKTVEKPETQSKKPKQVDIYSVSVEDFILFGENDLNELKDEYFSIKSLNIFEKENQINTYLFCSSTKNKQILIDNFSEKEHIYVYHEIQYEENISELISHDQENKFLSFLDTEVQDPNSFTFNPDSTQSEDKLWLIKGVNYYVQDKGIMYLHITTDKNYSPANNNGIAHMFYVFQTEDREYRMIVAFDENGNTKFYTGRRIEPYNIKRVISK